MSYVPFLKGIANDGGVISVVTPMRIEPRAKLHLFVQPLAVDHLRFGTAVILKLSHLATCRPRRRSPLAPAANYVQPETKKAKEITFADS